MVTDVLHVPYDNSYSDGPIVSGNNYKLLPICMRACYFLFMVRVSDYLKMQSLA